MAEDEKPSINIGKLYKNILTIAAVGIVGFLLWYLKSVTIYLLCGVILSLIARPLYIQMEKLSIGKFKVPGAINALVSILLVWVVLGGMVALLFPIVAKEAIKVTHLDPEKLLKQFEQPINQSILGLENSGLVHFDNEDTSTLNPAPSVVEKTIIYKLPCDSSLLSGYEGVLNVSSDTLIEVKKDVANVTLNDTANAGGIRHRKELEGMLKNVGMSYISIKKISSVFTSIFSLLGNIFATIASASFLAFFFLRDKNLFKNMVLAIVPSKYEKQVMVVMNESRKMLSRYFIGLVIELLAVMICTTIGLLIIGMKFNLAITIGFFCGFFNIIPYVGPLIGGLVGLFLGIGNYLEMDAYAIIFPLMIKMAIVFWVVQILDNNLFQTIIYSNTVNAHPIEIFLVIVIAGNIWGITGMIFAVPGYTFLRIIGKQFFSHFKLVRSLTQNME